MTMPLGDIEFEAMQLPLEERARLAERLAASLGGDASVMEAWVAEAEHRLNEFDRGETSGAPLEQVVASIRAHLSARKMPA